uniref:Uncharacterized protein n=1 Tax=Arundo donax TaxID=35708 RepID=A0A0A9CR30_ARUDO
MFQERLTSVDGIHLGKMSLLIYLIENGTS